MTPGLYVVMGVAAAGKSTIGVALARALGVDFVEGDDYHPAENRQRMAAGIPLTDADRHGWLCALAERLAEAARDGSGLVISCSALKRSYRDILRTGAGTARFIYLRGDRELFADRMASRRGHFMPPSLLDSQLATLEEPTADEGAWIADASASVEEIVRSLAARAAFATSDEPR